MAAKPANGGGPATPDATAGGETAVATTVDHLLEIAERPDGGCDLALVRSLSARTTSRGGRIAIPTPPE
ncbi:MAG TPA: hypothetical protein VFG37_03915 [Planctomycetota bacterium]|nr:hypothetical protein [Planctomycetota bacterium]